MVVFTILNRLIYILFLTHGGIIISYTRIIFHYTIIFLLIFLYFILFCNCQTTIILFIIFLYKLFFLINIYMDFKLRKSYQRILKLNQDLEGTVSKDLTCRDSYELYKSYISNRHSDGDMFPVSKEQYNSFILKRLN